MIAYLIVAGDQCGWLCLGKAMIPAHEGATREMPFTKLDDGSDESESLGIFVVGHDDSIFPFGAMISCFKVCPFVRLRPSEEKMAMARDRRRPNCVL